MAEELQRLIAKAEIALDAVIAANEREACAGLVEEKASEYERGVTCHDEVAAAALRVVADQIRARGSLALANENANRAAIAAEREACAKIAKAHQVTQITRDVDGPYRSGWRGSAKSIEAAIRARGGQ
jgi:hypothetical protein